MYIIGHRIIRERLKKLAREDKISQGYFFMGPQGVGKSLCALEFASILVGEPDFEPSGNKPYPFDVLIIRPEEVAKRGVTKEKSIGAETMREALQFLGSFPAAGRFRVVIVEEAHKLTHTAQSVILKNLEEPQSTAVMILVTHETGSILPTILSRVERIRFDYVSPEEIAAGLEALTVKNKDYPLAPFFFSLGRPGMIVRAVQDPQSFRVEQKKLERLFRLTALTLGERFRLAEELSKDVPQTVRLLEWWLPGLHTLSLKGTDIRHTTRFFRLLEDVERTLTLLKTTQSNARLLIERLFLSV